MKLLAIETSLEFLGLCLWDDAVVANHYSLSKVRGTQRIFAVLDQLLSSSKISLSEIDGYVVSCGPGSYTGLRVGMAVAHTLAQVHQRWVIEVSVLDLLASTVVPQEQPFQVLLNCTRSEVFCQKFIFEQDQLKPLSPIRCSPIEMIWTEIQEDRLFLKRIPSLQLKENLLFNTINNLPTWTPMPDAYWLLQRGFERLSRGPIPKPTYPQPLYIKREV